jgi:hypothetical protein
MIEEFKCVVWSLEVDSSESTTFFSSVNLRKTYFIYLYNLVNLMQNSLL